MVRQDLPFPQDEAAADWRRTRTRQPAAVNVQLRADVERDGHSLLRIGLTFADRPDDGP